MIASGASRTGGRVLRTAAVVLALAGAALPAQTPPPAGAAAPSASAAPAATATDELLKSYLELRSDLRDAQAQIARDRADAEAAQRSQAAAFVDRLNALKASEAADQQRQAAEAQRLDAERQMHEAEMQRANRAMFWVASMLGCAALVAVLAFAFFQSRTINRLAAAGTHPALPAPGAGPFPPLNGPAPASDAVPLLSERLESALVRMERRVLELEHTAAHRTARTEPASRVPPDPNADKIATLLATGRLALRANRPMEALGCFDELLRVDPNHAEALVKKGVALERLKQDQEAIRCYDRAIEADRKSTLAYLHKGGVFARLERFTEAVECYEQAMLVAEEGR